MLSVAHELEVLLLALEELPRAAFVKAIAKDLGLTRDWPTKQSLTFLERRLLRRAETVEPYLSRRDLRFKRALLSVEAHLEYPVSLLEP